jgi:hypothetical protein
MWHRAFSADRGHVTAYPDRMGEAALVAGGNRDYTLRILPKANHDMFEAKVGNNEEVASLQRFVPAYFTTVQDWLAKRIRGIRVMSQYR